MGKLYLIFGDDEFLIDDELERLKEMHNQYALDVIKSDSELKTIYQLFASQSLFADTRLIIIKNPWFVEKSLEKADIQSLEQCLNALSDSEHSCILCCYKPIDKRLKSAKLLFKTAQKIEVKGFKQWEQAKLMAWLKTRFTKENKSITQDALLALEHTGGTQLRQLDQECKKLIIYTGSRNKIELADVEAVCTGSAASIFKFNQSFQQKNEKACLESIRNLVSFGEDPVRLMGLLAANLSLYLQLMVLTQEGHNIDQIGKILGKHPYYLKNILMDINKHYTLADIKYAITVLATLDLHIKTGKIAAKNAILMTISRCFRTSLLNYSNNS